MEISWPSNVRHVAHVTFDRFNGFLGLPVEFEPEVPRRPPSASTRVFGVSTDCMQLSFDSRGNSVPTILLMMQARLYAQGGLQAEGIFRINAENGQEEYVREQLNSGIVPDNIDVHCLAGLIKAWFRELPKGVLDSLSPEDVIRAQSEEECVQLVRSLPPTEAALLDWVINLMADVVQMEHLNKMNARNVAMVFAPNMTQMADPLTALMYAVQVMNFIRTLLERIMRDREESITESSPAPEFVPFNENRQHRTPQPLPNDTTNSDKELDQTIEAYGLLTLKSVLQQGKGKACDDHFCRISSPCEETKDGAEGRNVITVSRRVQSKLRRSKSAHSRSCKPTKASKMVNESVISSSCIQKCNKE